MSDISVKLLGDNSQFRSSMEEAEESGVAYAGSLSSKVADKLVGLREVSTVVATALGLNLVDIATNIARTITGVSEESEKAYAAAEQASNQAEELAVKNMRAKLTEEQKLALALQDQAELQIRINDATDKMASALANANKYELLTLTAAQFKQQYAEKFAEQQKLNLELQQKQAEIADLQAKQDAASVKAFEDEVAVRSAAADKANNAMLATLDLDQRERVLRDEIVSLQTTLNDGLLTEESRKRLNTTLSEREAQLAETIAKQRESESKAAADLSKLRFDSLPVEEKIAAYQDSISTLEKLITDEKKKGLDTSKDELTLAQNQIDLTKLLATQEKVRSDLNDRIAANLKLGSETYGPNITAQVGQANKALADQVSLIESAVQAQTDLDTKVGMQVTAENQISDFISQQLSDLNDNNGVASFASRPLNHDDFAQVSDAALKEMIKRADTAAATYDPTSSTFNTALLNAGSVASGFFTEGMNQSMLLNVASSAQQELDLRNGIRSGAINVSNYQGDPMYFDRIAQSVLSTGTSQALNDIGSTQAKTLQVMQTISDQLSTSGFPKSIA